MIFTKHHLALVLAGTKTQTRRLGERRWQLGAVHPLKVGWYDKPAGWVRIVGVRVSRLGATTEEDASAEGYESLVEYRAAWERIYRRFWQDDLEVYVIDFVLWNKPDPPKQTTLFDTEEVSP